MQQNEQHEIDTVAIRLFQYVLPANLIVRGQEQGKDYGIDAEVEQFKNRQSTGKIFKAQIKGTKYPKYSANGNLVSLSLDIDRAEYLIDQIEIPTAIILCDITEKLVFWNVIHFDQSLRKAYELGKDRAQKTITVHFETCNKLPDTLEQLLNTFYKAGNILALKHGAKIRLQAYSEYVQNAKEKDLDSEIVRLRQRINIAIREKFHRRLDRQQILRDLARKEGRWKIGKHIPIDDLASIAEGMLKSNEKIEQKVVGNYTIENSFGNYEIVEGLLAPTNHRILVVLNAPQQGVRKDYFTYGQITTVLMTSDGSSISLIMPDEVITLYDLSDVDPYQEPENFYKYIIDKKTPPPIMNEGSGEP